MGRPKKENSLTPQDVVTAAIICIDKEGVGALGVNRVARELGIKPPAIYKHVKGNAGLERAVAIAVWKDYLDYFGEQTAAVTDLKSMMFLGAQATRRYAKQHFARYSIMMGYRMKPTDSEEAAIIQRSLQPFRVCLSAEDYAESTLIDIMRMVNAAIYGFIMREQMDLMTLKRSTDESYDVMLKLLLVAIQHVDSLEGDIEED